MDNPKILLVHDDETTRGYIKEKLVLNFGYQVYAEGDLRSGLEAFTRGTFEAVIIKFQLSDLDITDFIRALKEKDADAIIVAFIEKPEPQVIKDLLALGVYDFITKPINLEHLFFLIERGLKLRSLMLASRKVKDTLQEQNLTLQKQNTLLAKRIEESTKNLSRLYEDLRNTYMRTIKSLAQAIDARDHYTHSHSENVARYAASIAEEMHLPVRETELIRDACALHDLGKIGIDDRILSKPSSLTPEEWQDIKKHPLMGAKILEPLTFLNEVIDLVRQHHEHYDGTGYPQGLRGEDILLGARIIHLADAYEAMTSPRAYRKIPLSKEEALYEVKRNSGTQFDPKVVEAFLRVLDRL